MVRVKLSASTLQRFDDLTNHERRFVLESTITGFSQARGASVATPVAFGLVFRQYYWAALAQYGAVLLRQFVRHSVCFGVVLLPRSFWRCIAATWPSDVTCTRRTPPWNLLHAVYFHLA